MGICLRACVWAHVCTCACSCECAYSCLFEVNSSARTRVCVRVHTLEFVCMSSSVRERVHAWRICGLAHRRHHTARRAAMRRCTKANARGSSAAGSQAPTGDGDGARRMARSCSGRLSECTQALCSKTTRTCDERSHAAEGAQAQNARTRMHTRSYTDTRARARTSAYTNTRTHTHAQAHERARRHTQIHTHINPHAPAHAHQSR